MTQEQALLIMRTGVNVYLTGSAGSGKTHVLNEYIKYLNEHDISVAVTASTGIAATHMNGMTIHGWSGIGIREKMSDSDIEALEEKQYLWKRFNSAKVLIIDEVSMLHAHRLDMIDQVCRKFKRNDVSFGGLQVILSGDFFQLPPVNKSGDVNTKDMIMHSRAWHDMAPAICYLTEQHRQDDAVFTDILNAIRDNSLGDEHYQALADRHNANVASIRPTRLYTHNKNVDAENFNELGLIKSDAKRYTMIANGNDVMVDILKKSCLAHEELVLKVGAEVMFIKNNFEEGYVNGTRGTVAGFNSSGMPIVKLLNGKEIEAHPESWAIEEDGKIKASIAQVPLRLAWAITIHKSQGMSLDCAEIDLSNTFTYGMGYVALSRVRTLSGVRLVGFNSNALQVNPDVLIFDSELRSKSIDNENLFSKLTSTAHRKLEEQFIVRMGGTLDVSREFNKETKKTKKIPTKKITKKLLDEGLSLVEIAKKRDCTTSTVIGHISDLLNSGVEVNLKKIKPKKAVIDIVKKFNNNLKGGDVGKLSPLKNALNKAGYDMSFDEIRLAKIFIQDTP